MSQYGSAAKNPPWVRSGQAMGLNQTSQVGQPLMGQSAMSNMTNPSMLQYPQVFQGQMAAAQQMYGAVQYPTRALNSAAFSSGGGGSAQNALSAASGLVGSGNSGGGQSHGSSVNDQMSSSQAKQQRVFTGTVTKVQDNFGFVDNDVFFQSSCCVKGSSPQVGDRVLVEAVYNSNMPFKWNATRIQVLPGSGNQQQSSRQSGSYSSSGGGGSGGGSQSQIYSAVPPPSPHRDDSSSSSRFNSRFSSNDRNSGRDRNRDAARDRNRHQQREEDDRKRRRDDSRNRNDRNDDKDRTRSPIRKRSKSPQRPVARRAPQQRRAPPRYSVVVPKISLASREADVIELKKRYTNLYVPSDFFLSKLSWTETFPATKPLSLDFPCNFHVLHKDVDPLHEIKSVYEPSDADYIYSAKVMLLSSPGLDELFSKCCSVDEHSDTKSTPDRGESPSPSLTHPSRLLSFLVGTRNKEFLAIGGPWSPSLDGPDPSTDPGVLVKTAVRTCKALTGIDLSSCTQWFRFLEVHYHRNETTHHGRQIPARVETVVMFVPDVWSIGPSQLGWDEITAGFKAALNNKINPPTQQEQPADDISNNNNNNNSQSSDDHKDEDGVTPGSPERTNTEPKREPKHHTELDPKNMRVSELREELEARCLSPKGLKTQLAARLAKVIKSEAEEEQAKKSGTDGGSGGDNNEGETNSGNDKNKDKEVDKENKDKVDKDKENNEKTEKEATVTSSSTGSKRSADDSAHQSSDKKKKEEESDGKEKKKLDEREKMLLEKRYRLPDTPHIIVHPNRTFKSGKFDCSVVSLSTLLGYRQDDTKEHAFEVSLFAELFNEMLMRDFGFYIYKAALSAPERPKEEKGRDKDKDKDKDDDRKKDRKDVDSKDKDSKESDKDKDKDKDKEKSKIQKEEKKDKDENKMDIDEVEDEENTRESIKNDEEKKKDEDKKKDEESKKKDDDKRKDDDKKKESKKLIKYTDYNLLLSFSYFDTTRVGYVYDRDLEDLLSSLGLTLSRSQLRKLVQKIATRDSIYYKKLAEKTKEEGSLDDDNKEMILTEEMIRGNKLLLASLTITPPGSPSKKRRMDSPNTVKKTASGMVEYNGTLIDIGKLMDQLNRSEHTRVETEKSLSKLRADYNKLKESSSRSERYIKDLTADIKDYKERLYNSNSELCTLESKQKQVHSAMTEIQELIRPFLKSSSSSHSSSNNDPDIIEVKREDNGGGRSKRRKIEDKSTSSSNVVVQPTEIVEIKEDDVTPPTKSDADVIVKSSEK